MGNQRRVREDESSQQGEEGVPFSEAVIAASDETTWVLVGEVWVDTSRIISVAPLSAIWDEEQGKQGVPEPKGGVAVQIDSPHPDTQFIQTEDDSVEEIMSRIVDATSE